MHSRRFGNTSLQVTPLGLGLAALGRPGYINLGHADDMAEGRSVEHMEHRAHGVLDAAWARGLRYFDAARSYGLSERFLSSWINSRGIRPTIGSKWGYTYTADWQVDAEVHEVKEHSLAVLERQWDESHEWFGGRVDLYQIHSATLESGVLDNSEVLDELARLKADGLYIGFTTSGANQAAIIDKALAIELDGVHLFDAVQSTWNLLEPSAGPALAAAHGEGLGVIIKESLANGRLTARNTESEFESRRALLAGMADELDCSIDALALAGALAQPWADVVLLGAASIDQLDSNVQALDVSLAGREAELADALAEDPTLYWQKRSALAWN